LVALLPPLQKTARSKWGTSKPICERIVELDVGKESVVIGTLYKEMSKKPCLLDEINVLETQFGPDNNEEDKNYASEDDQLILEDESGRVSLRGAVLPVGRLSTGTVISVLGTVDGQGILHVTEFMHAGLAPQKPLAMPAGGGDKYLLLASGLGIGGKSNMLPLKLLVDFVCGHLGGGKDVSLGSKIVRMIVAGNSLAEQDSLSDSKDKTKAQKQKELTDPLSAMDLIFAELAASLPVDVMPGQREPTNYTLPQQPLHPCLFSNAARFSSFRTVTNPYDCRVGTARILGSSGEPLADMARYSTPGTDKLKLLEQTLECRLIAPTAPDTLACYPFYHEDPFVMTTAPHVYFSGNAPKYSTSVVKGSQGQRVRTICIPSFEDTNTVVLVNLTTLDCSPLFFGMS